MYPTDSHMKPRYTFVLLFAKLCNDGAILYELLCKLGSLRGCYTIWLTQGGKNQQVFAKKEEENLVVTGLTFSARL